MGKREDTSDRPDRGEKVGGEDEFAGRHWLNVVAAFTLMGSFVLPFFFPWFIAAAGNAYIWFAFCFLLCVGSAVTAYTMERLARIENRLGIDLEPRGVAFGAEHVPGHAADQGEKPPPRTHQE